MLHIGQRVWVTRGQHRGSAGNITWLHRAIVTLLAGVRIDGIPDTVVYDASTLSEERPREPERHPPDA